MRKTTKGRIAGALEFMLSALFIWGGISVLGAPVIHSGIKVLDPLLGHKALLFYSGLFTTLGLGLILAKLFKRRKIHGLALAGMFLTTIYAIILNAIFDGWDLKSLFNIGIALVTLTLWTRWRYKVIFDKLD